MKLKTMLYGLTLMLGCFVLAACVNDEEGPCLPDGKTQVLFSLVLQDNAQTRAGTETWNSYQPSETGVAYDNYIDLDNVQMLLFYADGSENDGKYAGKLGSMIHSKISENVYQYVGVAPSGLAAGAYKFVVLANCADAGLTVGTTTIPASTIADLDTKAFNLFADSGNTEYIPMWGILKTNLTLVAGNRQEIGRISLLRAISKVTVKLQAPEGATVDPLRGYSLDSVVVTYYNKSGYITPTGAATAETTKELKLDASLRAYASVAQNKVFAPATVGDTELTFYLPEYNNSTTTAKLNVTLSKTVKDKEGNDVKLTFKSPIQFCDYYTEGDNKGKPDTTKPYNIIRNHYYKFNIYSVSDDGALYVKPTVKDWIDATPIKYTIKMSTSMRLFDSWLYRYDTDGIYGKNNGKPDAAYNDWETSHMVVSTGRGTATETEPVAGRPLHSPQIQLVTTGVADPDVEGSGTFELYVDNSQFEILQAVKNDVGVVTSYVASNNGTLNIPAGDDVYTYFYIVPKEGVTISDPVAHVFLYYNDPILGKQEVTYNYNSLPGSSDDSAEIWVYYASVEQYEAGKYDDTHPFLRMYYKDSNNPLVPVQ